MSSWKAVDSSSLQANRVPYSFQQPSRAVQAAARRKTTKPNVVMVCSAVQRRLGGWSVRPKGLRSLCCSAAEDGIMGIDFAYKVKTALERLPC